MEITRRKFIVGAGSFITATTLARYQNAIDNGEKPIIDVPKKSDYELYINIDQEYQISLGSPNDFSLPANVPSWNEFLSNFSKKKAEELFQMWDLQEYTKKELDSTMQEDLYEGWYIDQYSPVIKAYNILDQLDLGDEIKSFKEGSYGLNFMNGPVIGSDYRGVHCNDEMSISLLQARLRELNEPAKLVVIDF